MSTRQSTYELLRQQVLARLAESQVDRDREPDRVRELIGKVVAGYQSAASAGVGGQKLGDPEQTAARLSRSVLAYGPLQPFVDGLANGSAGGPDVVEVEVRGRAVAWKDGRGRWHSAEDPATEDELRSVVDRMLQAAGAQLTEAHPVVSVQVLDRRVRLTASIPPISDALEANLRFYGRSWRSLQDLVRLETLSGPAANFLWAAMRHPQSGVLVSGRPQSGKTTMANALLRAVPHTHVVACCEDTRELSAPLPHASYRKTSQHGLASGTDVTLGRLVELALRSSPDRIVVGEVRGREAAVLTRAANAGSALLATLHSSSAEDALNALAETALLFADHNMPAETVRSRFARSIDVVVHLDSEDTELRGSTTDRPVRRQVMEIAAVSPLQASGERFSVIPVFQREAIGAPLQSTRNPLPPVLERKLTQVLARYGTGADQLLEGREVMHT